MYLENVKKRNRRVATISLFAPGAKLPSDATDQQYSYLALLQKLLKVEFQYLILISIACLTCVP